MTRWLLRLYPSWFRGRYGDEIAESDHRARDVVSVAAAALRLRWETT